MKVAHVKTVDGTTIMISIPNETFYSSLFNFILDNGGNVFIWNEDKEQCVLFHKHIISVRFREVLEQ